MFNSDFILYIYLESVVLSIIWSLQDLKTCHPSENVQVALPRLQRLLATKAAGKMWTNEAPGYQVHAPNLCTHTRVLIGCQFQFCDFEW